MRVLMIFVVVLLPLQSVEAQQSDLLWPFTSGGGFGSQVKASKLNSGVVLQSAGEQSSKLTAGGILQNTAVQSSKLIASSVLQNSAAEASKIVASSVLQNSAAKASKIVAYAVLKNTPSGLLMRAPLTHW